MMPNISVIIPCYNVQKYLKQCLDSVVAQTFKNMEVLCVDDGSTDETEKILAQYVRSDDRFRVISLKNNHGTGFSRNLGLKKAKGKYILFLDADDFFKRNMIKKLYQQAQKTDADIVFCGFDCFDERTGRIQKINWDIDRGLLPKEKVFSVKKGSAELWNLIPSVVWNQLYRRNFLTQIGLAFKNTKSCEDIYFSKVAFLSAKKVSYIDKKLLYYRVRNINSNTYHQPYLDAVRAIYALYSFLLENRMLKKYKKALFDRALLIMSRSLIRPEPDFSLLRSFYLKYLIPRLWGNIQMPKGHLFLQGLDTITKEFKQALFRNQKHIFPIVFATDKVHASMVGIAIEAIKENKSDFYDIYVLHENLSAITQFNLTNLSEKNVRVTCINVLEKVERYFRKRCINSALYRFLIPELLTRYEKVLYLEPNVLPQKNLKQFFKFNMGQQAIAGLQEGSDKDSVLHILNISSRSVMNSQILLFNMLVCRKMNLMERIITDKSLY